MNSDQIFKSVDTPICLVNIITGVDSNNGRTFFNLELKNICEKTITKIKFKAHIYENGSGSSDHMSNDVVNFIINDIEIKPNSTFYCERRFYLINHMSISKLEIDFDSVWFIDGLMWDRNHEFQKTLNSEASFNKGVKTSRKKKYIFVGALIISIVSLSFLVVHLVKENYKLKDNIESVKQSDNINKSTDQKVNSPSSLSSNVKTDTGNTTEINTTADSVYTIEQLNAMKKFGEYDEVEGFYYFGISSDDLGFDLINNFNNSWIEYVNNGSQTIFNYILKDSPAYKSTIEFKPGSSTQRFLEIKVRQATVIGDNLYIKVHEKLEITKPEGITVKNYDWIYHAKFDSNQFKIFDYFKDEYPANDLAINETFADNKLPFYLSGTFLGGDISDGIEIKEIRYGKYDQYDRFVLDCFEFNSPSNLKSSIVPFYNVRFDQNSNSAMFYLSGVRRISAPIEDFLKSELIQDVYSLPVYDDQAFAFILKFRAGTAIKVFEIENNARIVIDILK